MSLPPFALRYSDHVAGGDHLLGVIAFTTEKPDLPAGCPFLTAPLREIAGKPAYEIWTARDPVQYLSSGAVSGSFNDDIAFGAVTLDEDEGMAAAAERLYHEIFDFLGQAGGKAPIRFWNYLTDILAEADGMERYRRFNIGRHRAFSARLAQNLPPAASGVGGHVGKSVIYFLAAPEPARPVENPRQVSAFNYPPVYGPRSPSFSRASVHGSGASCVFVSGTASITGHETRHVGDLPGQIDETIENLRAVIAAAGAAPDDGNWALKVYLHDPASLALAAAGFDSLFGAAPRLYLHGEICRQDLLLEVEAFRQFQPQPI